MSTSWRDLTSKSDIFYQNLPLFNRKGALEDNYSFKLTAKPKNGKYTFSANHTNGERGKVEFSGSETYSRYHDTELGYKINNKPGVELTAKFTDKLIPVSGSSFTLSLSAVEREERASLQFKYAANSLHALFGVSVPLTHQVFNLPVHNEENKQHNKLVQAEVVYRLHENRDYYFGIDATYQLPNENETPKYDVRGVLANKTGNFEGGVFIRRSDDREASQFGSYVTAETENLTLSSNFAYRHHKKEFHLDNFVSFPGSHKENRYLLGIQVSPKTSLSLGVERNIDSNTKISFAYAYIISKEENNKRSALRVNVELSN